MPGEKPKGLRIGDRLRALRTQCRLSQKEVADLMGMSPATVSDYETGISEPRADFMTRFALEFNTTVEWLVTGAETTRTTTPGAATVSPRLVFLCDGCSEKVPQEAAYCPHCGAQLTWDDVADKVRALIRGFEG
jgi:transcriptional regulator with XRE-family HTH domain